MKTSKLLLSITLILLVLLSSSASVLALGPSKYISKKVPSASTSIPTQKIGTAIPVQKGNMGDIKQAPLPIVNNYKGKALTTTIMRNPAYPNVGETVTLTIRAQTKSYNSGILEIVIFDENGLAKKCQFNPSLFAECIYSVSFSKETKNVGMSVSIVQMDGKDYANANYWMPRFDVENGNRISDTPNVLFANYPSNPIKGQTILLNVDAFDDSKIKEIVIFGYYDEKKQSWTYYNKCTPAAKSGNCKLTLPAQVTQQDLIQNMVGISDDNDNIIFVWNFINPAQSDNGGGGGGCIKKPCFVIQ